MLHVGRHGRHMVDTWHLCRQVCHLWTGETTAGDSVKVNDSGGAADGTSDGAFGEQIGGPNHIDSETWFF